MIEQRILNLIKEIEQISKELLKTKEAKEKNQKDIFANLKN